MKAYHLQTREPDPYSFIGNNFKANFIYIPDKNVLVGLRRVGNHKLVILNHSRRYHERAQNIVDGNKNGVKGDVVSELDVAEDDVDKIDSNSHELRIKVTENYDDSTNMLVKILSGEFRKKGILERLVALK